MVSGRGIWYNTCGAYATGHAVRLAKSCEGPVDIKAAGGRAQQLRKLRAGKHPKAGHRLSDAVPWHRLNKDQQTEFGAYESSGAPHGERAAMSPAEAVAPETDGTSLKRT